MRMPAASSKFLNIQVKYPQHVGQPCEDRGTKNNHTEAVDEPVRTGDAEFSRVEFLAHLESIRSQTFKKSTFLSLFRQTGLIPFNSNICLDELSSQTPPTTETRTNESQPPQTPIHRLIEEMRTVTSTTVRYLTYQATVLANPNYSPSTRATVHEKYVKGSLAKINSGWQMWTIILQ